MVLKACTPPACINTFLKPYLKPEPLAPFISSKENNRKTSALEWVLCGLGRRSIHASIMDGQSNYLGLTTVTTHMPGMDANSLINQIITMRSRLSPLEVMEKVVSQYKTKSIETYHCIGLRALKQNILFNSRVASSLQLYVSAYNTKFFTPIIIV